MANERNCSDLEEKAEKSAAAAAEYKCETFDLSPSLFPPEEDSAAVAAAPDDLDQSVDGVRSLDDASVFATPSAAVTSSALARRTKQVGGVFLSRCT